MTKITPKGQPNIPKLRGPEQSKAPEIKRPEVKSGANPFTNDRLIKSGSGHAPPAMPAMGPMDTLAVPGAESSSDTLGPGGKAATPTQLLKTLNTLPVQELPDVVVVEAAWADFLQDADVTTGVRTALESQFESLVDRHGSVRDQEVLHEAKLSRVEIMAGSEDAISISQARLETGDVETSSVRLQAEVDSLRLDVKEFLEQIHTAGDNPRRAKLSSQARALLDSLGEMPELPDAHNSAYASFIADYGEDTAKKHHLDKSVENIRRNVQILGGNAKNLEGQIEHVTDLLERSSSTRSLKRVKKHVEYLKPHFESHRKQVASFQKDVQKFVDFMDGLRENKAAAKIERQEMSDRKAGMLNELQSYLDMDYDASAFKDEYAHLNDTMGSEALAQVGLDRNYEVMIHNLSNVQNGLHQVRNYAQMLFDDISKADHMGWLDARVENLASLKGQFKDYEGSRDNFESQLSGFRKQMSGLAETAASIPFDKQVESARERLTHAPTTLEADGGAFDKVEKSIADFPGDRKNKSIATEANVLKGDLVSLEASLSVVGKKRAQIETLLGKASSPQELKDALQGISSYSTLVEAHNSEVRTFQRRTKALLKSLPGAALESLSGQQEKRALTSAGKTLLGHVQKKKTAMFDTLNISRLNYSDGRVLNFTAEDRAAVWGALLEKNPRLSVDALDKRGHSLLHNVVLSASLNQDEKVTMVEALVGFGADVNQVDRQGHPPVDTALRLAKVDTAVIETLRGHGARVSDARRIPALAHLFGASGHVKVKEGAKTRSVSLEGLAPRFAAFGLDPAITESLDEVKERSVGDMKSILQSVERGWVDTQSYSKFLGRVQDAKVGIDSLAGAPEVLMTGWDHPNGHAVGFVFNQEGDKHYFYACNAGDAKDPHRSIVKYEVQNFDKLLKFLRGCERNRDETRSLFVGKPIRMGLGRCMDYKQLPDAIDKASQKRGNCTVSSRKACVLAMMWSEGIVLGADPKVVKDHYKQVTTELRERGVRGTIETGHIPLMGKALVEMLTKFDREPCRGYAFEVANAIVQQNQTGKTSRAKDDSFKAPDSGEAEFMTTIRNALDISKASLDERDNAGRSLLARARFMNNNEAARVLEQVGARA